VTHPPSKHASQLFVAYAELDAQLTDLFSPRFWEVAITGAAFISIGVAGAVGVGAVGTIASPEAANTTVVVSEAIIRNERTFCIGEKLECKKLVKKHCIIRCVNVKKNLVKIMFLTTIFVHISYNNILQYVSESTTRAPQSH
jgi:hypothetical protein